MEHNPPTTNRPVHIPPVVWFLGLGLIVTLVAIFVFSIPLGTVGYYALFAFFIGSHFFMHGSHAGHGGHTENGLRTTNADGPAEATQAKDEQSRSGGCH